MARCRCRDRTDAGRSWPSARARRRRGSPRCRCRDARRSRCTATRSQAVHLQRMARADRDVVEEAKAHGRPRARMVAGRAHRAERIAPFAAHDAIGRRDHGTGGVQRRLVACPGSSRCRVERNSSRALVRWHCNASMVAIAYGARPALRGAAAGARDCRRCGRMPTAISWSLIAASRSGLSGCHEPISWAQQQSGVSGYAVVTPPSTASHCTWLSARMRNRMLKQLHASPRRSAGRSSARTCRSARPDLPAGRRPSADRGHPRASARPRWRTRWPSRSAWSSSASSSPATCCRPTSSAFRSTSARAALRVPPGPDLHAGAARRRNQPRHARRRRARCWKRWKSSQVTADGVTRPLPHPFFVIATQNPLHQVGTFPLPESQLDRFLMRIELGYPDAAAERALLIGEDRREHAARRSAADAWPAELVDRAAGAKQVHTSARCSTTCRRWSRHSRAHRPISRRPVAARRARAAGGGARLGADSTGRDHVVPEDVQTVLPPVAATACAAAATAARRCTASELVRS